ncbi:hypothetical protein BDQ17DRAFT_1245535 [Cyathus striatus]|nr:hypothetical protein BDQ17DRAFT_1245535 [Cyathus striatus]
MGNSAGQFKTMDDVRDEERLREEDDEEVWRGSSGDEEEEDEGQESEEVEAVFSVEEKMLIGEVDDDYDDDDDDDLDGSDDDEETPQRGFQARLERLREKARGKKAADDSFDGGQKSESDEDDEDDILQRHMTWAEEDDYFLDQIQAGFISSMEILAENEDVLTGRNRKADKKLFNAIRDGEFDEMDSYGSPARRKKDKWKDVPPHLREQWEKDRQKKAERKQARELEKMERAADALALKKGGKKGRKVMLAASRLDPTITVLPNRIIDMSTLVQQIRRFIAEINGPNSMSLPPTNKETRKNIHEMAEAFGLKSASKGKGDARYTTLHKTSRTGIVLNEKKISWIVRRSGGAGARGSQFVYTESSNARKGATPVVPRHKEGDEVGKAAPKINQSNIGFRMLASMGWSEGDRIGMSGGLDAPLTAIIKNTKLGLGATK